MEHAKEKGIGRLLIRGDRAVNFRPVLLFAAAFALGIFAAFRFGTVVLWCGLLFVPVAGGALLFGHCKHRTVIGFVLYAVLFCALFCAGALAFAVRIGGYEAQPAAEGEYTVSGRIENVAASGDGTVLLVGDLALFASPQEGILEPAGTMSVYVFGGCPYEEGDAVLFDAVVEALDAWMYGRLNTSALIDGTRYRASVRAEGIYFVGHSFDLFGASRGVLRDRVFAAMDEDTAAIAYALLTGDCGFIDGDSMQNFRYGGIAHVFAVSGMHIALVYGLMSALLKKLRAGPWVRLPVVAAVLVYYTGVCGFASSAVRALVMCLVLMLFDAFGAAYDRLTSVGIAFFAELLWDPVHLFSAGFQLSVAAAAGIIVVGGHITRLLGRVPHFPAKAASAIGVSLSAQAATFPVLLNTFGYVPALSLLLNLVFVPLIGAAFSLLFVCAALAAALPFAGTVLLYVPRMLLRVAVAPVLAAEFRVLLIGGFAMGGAAVLCWFLALFVFSDKVDLRAVPKAVLLCLLGLAVFFCTLADNLRPAEGMTVHSYYDTNAVLVRGGGECALVLTGVPDGEYLERLFLQEGVKELGGLVVLADNAKINAAIPVVLGLARVGCVHVPAGGGFVSSFQTVEVRTESNTFSFGGMRAVFAADTALYVDIGGAGVLFCGEETEPSSLPRCEVLVACAYGEELAAACAPSVEVYFEKAEGKISLYRAGSLQIVWKDGIISVGKDG